MFCFLFANLIKILLSLNNSDDFTLLCYNQICYIDWSNIKQSWLNQLFDFIKWCSFTDSFFLLKIHKYFYQHILVKFQGKNIIIIVVKPFFKIWMTLSINVHNLKVRLRKNKYFYQGFHYNQLLRIHWLPKYFTLNCLQWNCEFPEV